MRKRDSNKSRSHSKHKRDSSQRSSKYTIENIDEESTVVLKKKKFNRSSIAVPTMI